MLIDASEIVQNRTCLAQSCIKLAIHEKVSNATNLMHILFFCLNALFTTIMVPQGSKFNNDVNAAKKDNYKIKSNLFSWNCA